MRFRGVVYALVSALLLIGPATLSGSVAGPAAAAPGDPPDPAVVTLPWKGLGLASEVFLGPYSATSFTVPVPPGLTPVRLVGLIHAPMNIGSGFLEIDDSDGKFLAAVGLPAAGAAQAVTPFDVDISAARLRTTSIDLTFTVRPVDNGSGFCGPLQQLTLSDLATVFAGSELPVATVGAFFPPVLEKVTIYTPVDADAAEKQAVLTLVSTLSRLYRSQPVVLAVATQPRGAAPPPAGPLARAVVVESGPIGLSVEQPGNPAAYLRLSGRGDSLTNQVSVFANQLQALLQASTSRVDQPGASAPPSGNTLTFSQLKMSGKTDVLRTSSLRIGVERSALGSGRVDSVQVHLLADYTPVPNDDAASVMIRSNGVVVYRSTLDNTGRLNATFDLPSQTFGQWINLDLAFGYTPHQVCGPLLSPMSFQVDPRSTLTVNRGGDPLAGFGAVPSEFSPGFMVAFDDSSPNQLSYAARIIAAIARLTDSPLTPRVVDLKTAVDAPTGALIVATSKAIKQTALSPPAGGDGTGVNVGLPTELQLNVEGGIGSIQAFADRPRNRAVVLVTTTDSWTLVDPLFTYLDGLEGGWTALTGDVLAAGAAGVPTNVAVRADDSTFAPPPPHKRNLWLPGGIGAGVLAVIAILAAMLWSSRRRTATTAGPPADAPSPPADESA